MDETDRADLLRMRRPRLASGCSPRTDGRSQRRAGGREYYESLVRHYTTLDITAKEVHEMGLSEVARLRAEMQAVIARVAVAGCGEAS
jgi:uncharacterized protein (DUF885 family)